ncbi:MAG: hypothetical protein CBC25_00535 [Pelagibacteraceae bacterium TMED65]|nr:MAG: hypothetical protein CBC25_00535 [Pelagibacteraceae bacterium TMED65]
MQVWQNGRRRLKIERTKKSNVERINALVLAAGLGTRLRPLTNTIPKCLVEIDGKPMLGRWIETLAKVSNKIIINTHYLHKQVENYIENDLGSPSNIYLEYEQELEGTAGTLLKVHKTYSEYDTLLLIHADNLTDANISEFLEAHKKRPNPCMMTMMLFECDNPQECGIVEIDEKGILTDFHEKKNNPPGNMANAAIYAIDKSLLKDLAEWGEIRDFSTEVIPKLISQIYTYKTNGYLLDIGTYKNLERARHMTEVFES